MADFDEIARKGIAAINENNLEEALTLLNEALVLQPDRPDIHNAIGMAHMRRGDVGNGLPFLEQAVQLANTHTSEDADDMRFHCQNGLATAYQLLDRVSDAIQSLKEMGTQWPDKTEVPVQLGQLLFQCGNIEEGLEVYRELIPKLEGEELGAVDAIIGATEAYLHTDLEGDIFLHAHHESYVEYFNEITAPQEEEGWITEAARMARGDNSDPKPLLAENARPYALSRVDLVNPEDGTVAGVYSDQEPMIVSLDGLEPLAQLPVLFPWPGYSFEILVCSQCPWHWLNIIVQFEKDIPGDGPFFAPLDEVIGEWYLSGFNGDFGQQSWGRFHYITDPDLIGTNACAYTIDLGRADFEAIPRLLQRLSILNEKHTIRRVLFGNGRLAD